MQPSTANLPPQYSQPPPKRTSNQGYFYSIPGIANIGLIVINFNFFSHNFIKIYIYQ